MKVGTKSWMKLLRLDCEYSINIVTQEDGATDFSEGEEIVLKYF